MLYSIITFPLYTVFFFFYKSIITHTIVPFYAECKAGLVSTRLTHPIRFLSLNCQQYLKSEIQYVYCHRSDVYKSICVCTEQGFPMNFSVLTTYFLVLSLTARI